MDFATAHNKLVMIVSIMGMIGIPSLFVIASGCVRFCIKHAKQINILMKAQQEQMKSELFEKYKKYMKQGWIDLEDLEVFESSYQAYHALGKNGVMDSKRDELLRLPNQKYDEND